MWIYWVSFDGVEGKWRFPRFFSTSARNVVNSKLFLESDNLNNRTEILNFPTGIFFNILLFFNGDWDPVKELRDFHYYLPQFHFHGFNQKQNNNDSIVIMQCLWLWTSWPLTNKIILNLHLYFFLTWLLSYLVIRESFRAILYILQPNRNRIESLIQLKSSLSKSWWKLWLFIGTSIWNHSPTMHTPFHRFLFFYQYTITSCFLAHNVVFVRKLKSKNHFPVDIF